MAFDDETIDVLIGGYLSKDAAMEDYESVLGCGGYLHGAVVVTKDLEGNLDVEQTDHLVREGRGRPRRHRVRGRPVRATAARGDGDRRRHRSGGRQAAPPSHRRRSWRSRPGRPSRSGAPG